MDDMKYLFLRVFFFFSFSKWKKILFYLLDVSKLMGPRTSTWLRRNSDPVRMDDMKYLFLRVFFFFSFSKWKKILFYLLDVSKLMGPRTSTWLRRNSDPVRMDEMKYLFLRVFFFSFLFPNGKRLYFTYLMLQS